MADKKSLLIYYDYAETIFSELSWDEIGMLVMAIIAYDRDGIVNDFKDRTVRTTFKRMMADCDRNREEYEETCAKNKKNIEKRWEMERAKKAAQANASDRIPTNTSEYERIENDTSVYERNYPYTKNTDKDIDTDKDKGMDIDTHTEKDKGIGCGEREKEKHIYTPDEVAPLFIEKFYSLYPLKINRGELKDFVYGKRLTQEQCHNLIEMLMAEKNDGIVICQSPDVWLAEHYTTVVQ